MWPFILIVGTWVLAIAVGFPLANRTDGAMWALVLTLALGCSGSIAAALLTAQ